MSATNLRETEQRRTGNYLDGIGNFQRVIDSVEQVFAQLHAQNIAGTSQSHNWIA